MKTIAKILPSLILAVSVSSVANAVPQYAVTELGVIPNSNPHPLINTANTTGAFAGSLPNISGPTQTAQAIYYDGTLHNIGTLGGTDSYASAINTNNHVVGHSYLADDSTIHAFLYDGAMHNLGTLGGASSFAKGINNSNSVVGLSDVAGGNASHAFLYDGGMHDLGTLGGTNSDAIAINNNGIVVGNSAIAGDTANHAFMYNGSMHDLGTLGGNNSGAVSISSNGIIVGDTTLAGDNISHAFLYDGTMHDLGTLGGDTSIAIGVNDKGWAVGWSQTDPSDSLASAYFLYDGSKMYNLNMLVAGIFPDISIDQVFSINDNGDIFALGYDVNGDTHLYNLNQVPLPAGAWLFGSCLTGLVGLRRKSKNS
jgi:probable HAF family extracellular repeat protein